MLSDCRSAVERASRDRQRRRMLPAAFGEFIAGLDAWSWWVTITFREPGVEDANLAGVMAWNADIAAKSSEPVGWVLAEEFGSLGGRYHCHEVMRGTAKMYRRLWWSEAFRRFGRSSVEPFLRDRGAAFYAAKYAAKQLGGLHFGGSIGGVDVDIHGDASVGCGCSDVARSDELERSYFRVGLGRWHR